MFNTLQPHRLQHTRLPCPSLSPGVCSDSCSLSTHDAIHPSCPLLPPFSFCPQSFTVSGSFPMSWLLASGGQDIVASASASGLPMNIQGWFPFWLTSLIFLLSTGLSRVLSRTTIWKQHFFSTQHSLWSSSQGTHDYWQNYSFDYMDLCQQNGIPAF